MANAHKKRGFSLIELAIVLVIIGLLSGGVLIGQSLIRNAELQAAINEVGKYKDAIATFQQKYIELPGDMSDATNYWGELNSTNCHTRNAIADGNGRETCNGNGNGTIDIGHNNGQELFHSWLQLKNAGLIEGAYTAVRGTAPYQAIPGINVPRSAIDDGGYTLIGFDTTSTPPANWWTGEYQPAITMGKQSATAETNQPLLEPEEAWNIDTKLDDSRPGTGKVRSFRSGDCNTITTTTGSSQTDTQYAVATQIAACGLIFSIQDPGF